MSVALQLPACDIAAKSEILKEIHNEQKYIQSERKQNS